MGPRADFYLGKGRRAQWLGSIGFSGQPEDIPRNILTARTKKQFEGAVGQLLDDYRRQHLNMATPKMGWPWPWEISHLTDYAYAFCSGQVVASNFGHRWFDPKNPPENTDCGRRITMPLMAPPEIIHVHQVPVAEQIAIRFVDATYGGFLPRWTSKKHPRGSQRWKSLVEGIPYGYLRGTTLESAIQLLNCAVRIYHYYGIYISPSPGVVVRGEAKIRVQDSETFLLEDGDCVWVITS